MAVPYYGDIAEDSTVRIPFNTFSSDDPQASVTITNLADADIMVHKDGGLTQIVTDGATVIINFDSITGNHLITVDTSVHADYSTGSEYAVRIEGTTVDAGTINAWVGAFSIERAGGAIALLKGTNSLADIEGKIDTAQLDLDKITGSDGATLATAQGLYAPSKAGDNMGTVSSVTGNVDGSVASVTAINATAGAIDNVTLVATTTTNTDMRGTDSANTTTPPTAAAIVNEWETQSQADPTGFHVNVKEVNGTTQTANDNSADINTILSRIIGTLATGTHNPITTAQIAVLTDWINGGRLDLLLDRLITEMDTARGEPAQGAPAVSTKIGDKIDYLYKAWRNKTEQTATTLSVYNDAGTVVDHKATVSDDTTTATNGEIVSGP